MARWSKAISVGLLIGTLGMIASLAPGALYLEEKLGLDLLFRLRGVREPPSNVIIVSLDQVSVDTLDLPADPDKWPRFLHANLTEILSQKGVAVIVFDMMFHEPGPLEQDNLFAQAIQNAGNVVLCACLQKKTAPLTDKHGKNAGELIIERLLPPIPELERSALAIAPFPLPKVPVKVSQYWTFKTEAGDAPTLPVLVFQVFMFDVYEEFIRLIEKVGPSQNLEMLHDKDTILKNKWVEETMLIFKDLFKENPLIGKKMIEEIQNSSRLSSHVEKKQALLSWVKIFQGPNSRYLNFYGPPGTIQTIAYSQLLKQNQKSAVKQRQIDLRGKAVFVGLSESFRLTQKDGFYTVFSQSNGMDISGVEIAASAFANLLEDKPIQPLVFSVHLITIFLWGILLGTVCLFLRPVFEALSMISMGILYLTVATIQFNKAGSWYPIFVPIFIQLPIANLGTFFWSFFETNKERQNVRRVLGYYLPDNEVNRLAKNLGDIRTNIQTVYGTCLFTDAEKYTSLSENMEPKVLAGFINKYFEAVFEPVRRYGGFVSDIKGDSMLSIWATAKPDTGQRKKACLAALDIPVAVEQFKQNFHTFQLPTRIGMHSGFISLGSVGAMNRYEYRPVGDIVNTASRIENLNKYLGTRILVSQEVLHEIDGFLTRKLGKFIFVGKSKPVTVYELMSRIEKSSEQQRDLCTTFTKGLNAYHKQCWQEAIKAFDESIKIHKIDGPSSYYLHLCEKYKANPPGKMWDGLIYLENK
jgi:adenylate cyclase